MTPLLNHWDETFATPEEKKLAIDASVKSGMKGLKSAQLGQQTGQQLNRAAA
jgi:alkane 1-monooxygenase